LIANKQNVYVCVAVERVYTFESTATLYKQFIKYTRLVPSRFYCLLRGARNASGEGWRKFAQRLAENGEYLGFVENTLAAPQYSHLKNFFGLHSSAIAYLRHNINFWTLYSSFSFNYNKILTFAIQDGGSSMSSLHQKIWIYLTMN